MVVFVVDVCSAFGGFSVDSERYAELSRFVRIGVDANDCCVYVPAVTAVSFGCVWLWGTTSPVVRVSGGLQSSSFAS